MNNTDRTKNNYYIVGLLLAGFLAFALRFFLLDKQPLNDTEAVNALQALGFSQGGTQPIGSEAGYVAVTSIWFFLFGAGNFGAKLLPAVSGTALALTPWLFRKQIGYKAALLLCFTLAIDAGWVAISRQAFGMSWAGLFLVLALAALMAKKSALFGAFSALALLGGSSFWQGATGLALASLIYVFAFRPLPVKGENVEGKTTGIFSGIEWKAFLYWFLGTLVVTGTLLLLITNGLNAAANGIVAYFSGWGQTSAISIKVMVLGLLLSQPLGFLFASIGAVRAFFKTDSLDIFLAIWWLVSMLLALIYPSREMVFIGWAELPMLALATRQITNLLNPDVEHKWAAVAQGVLVFVLLIFVWMSFVSFLQFSPTDNSLLETLATPIIPGLIIIGSIFFVRYYWSEETAGQGALWGLLVVLLTWGFSAAWNGAGLGTHPETSIWHRGPVMDEIDLLDTTLSDLSSWQARVPGYVDLKVVDIDSPGLRWALRDYAQVEFITSSSPASSPPMVITGQQASPNLADSYRGQDFVLQVKPVWQNMTFDQWLDWIAFKTAPLEKSSIVLWARSDLFIGEGNTP